MQLSDVYAWELETCDGKVYRRGGGTRWQDVPEDTVLRASLVPQTVGLSRVDVFCHAADRFRGWFGKGFLKQASNFNLTEYVQCLQTTQRRVWVMSDGRVMVTHPDFELRV